MLIQDNLDVACSAIEKAAMERAVTDVEVNFAPNYESRRRHREVSRSAVLSFTYSILSPGTSWPELL